MQTNLEAYTLEELAKVLKFKTLYNQKAMPGETRPGF